MASTIPTGENAYMIHVPVNNSYSTQQTGTDVEISSFVQEPEYLEYFTVGQSSPPYVKDRMYRIFQVKTLQAIRSTNPSITVPDLEDSIEAMFARRAAGIPDSSPRSMGSRVYPTDPQTVVDARTMVENLTKQLTIEQENLKQEAENLKAKREAEAEAAKKEREMYQQFKEEKAAAKKG